MILRHVQDHFQDVQSSSVVPYAVLPQSVIIPLAASEHKRERNLTALLPRPHLSSGRLHANIAPDWSVLSL